MIAIKNLLLNQYNLYNLARIYACTDKTAQTVTEEDFVEILIQYWIKNTSFRVHDNKIE